MLKVLLVIGFTLVTVEVKAANNLVFSDIVKNDSASAKYCTSSSYPGGICYMTQKNAIDYCASQQNRLPSAREMAQLSSSFGAKGVVNSCEGDPQCYYIKAENLNKTIDEFTFSNSGYSRPNGDLGKNDLWSSSLDPAVSGYAFFFSGYFGDIFHDPTYVGYSYNAVRCDLAPHSVRV